MRIYRLLRQRLRRIMRDDTVIYRNTTKACVDNYYHKVDGMWHQFQPIDDGTWAIDGIIFRSDLDVV